MRKPVLIETREIPLSEIDISNRLRPVSKVAVASLASSIEDQGLQQEVLLQKPRKKGAKFKLIAGGHRCAAFALMSLEAIPAKVYDCTDNAARLMEIDDNLAHAGLAPLDFALFLAERKRVYEKAFPQSRRGAMGGHARHGQLTAQNAVSSFVATAVEHSGLKERQIFKLVSIGTRLTKDEIKFLRKCSRPVLVADLEALSKIGDAAARIKACKAVSEGTAKTVRDALRQQNGLKDKPVSNKTAQSEKLMDAWARASADAKKLFVAQVRDDLESILAALPTESEVVSFTSRREQA